MARQELLGKAQAEDVARVRRDAVAPTRNTAARSAAVPAASAEQAVRARRRAGGIRLAAAAVRAKPVLTPLKHIAAHVVDAKFVRSLGRHIVRSVAAVRCVPCYVVYRVAAAVGVTIALIAAAGCILPLRLRWQTERLARQLVHLRDERLAIVPTDLFHRKLAALEIAGIPPHHSLPKLLRHLRLADAETAQCHLMNWLLTAVAGRAAHLERTALNGNHIERHAVHGIGSHGLWHRLTKYNTVQLCHFAHDGLAV